MEHCYNKVGYFDGKLYFGPTFIIGGIFFKGGMYLPQADSGRLVIGFWWIVVIVIVTTYCGNLVAFLTFPKFQPGLDYFFQLYKHYEFEQFGLRNGTYFEKYAMVRIFNLFSLLYILILNK